MSKRSLLNRYKDRLSAFFNRFRSPLMGYYAGERIILDNRKIDATFTKCELVYLGGVFHIVHMDVSGDSTFVLHDAAERSVIWLRELSKASKETGAENIAVATFGKATILKAAEGLKERPPELSQEPISDKEALELAALIKSFVDQPVSIEVTQVVPVNRPQQIRMVPVYRLESARCFMDPGAVEPWMDPSGVLTSALCMGVKMDLLVLSNNDKLLEVGNQDITDCLDPAISVEKIYCLYEGSVYPALIENMPTSNFVYDVASDCSRLVLQLNEMVLLATADNKRVGVQVKVSGVVNLQYGTIELYASPGTSPDVKLLGYTLRSFRVNPNRLPYKFEDGEYPVDMSHAR